MKTNEESRVTCNNPACEKICQPDEINASAAGYCAACEKAAQDTEAARLASAVPVEVRWDAEKEAVKALLKFISKDETRYALHFLGVFPDYVAATDGHKLLKVERTGLVFSRNGGLIHGRSYSVAKKGKELLLIPEADAWAFPNVDGVTPKQDEATFFFVENNGGDGKARGRILYHLAKNNVQLDADQLKALPEKNFEFYGTRALSPVLCVSDCHNYTAVFMPMRGTNVDGKGDKKEQDYTPPAVLEARAALEAAEAAASVAADAETLTPEEVKADVDKLNAMLEAGPYQAPAPDPVEDGALAVVHVGAPVPAWLQTMRAGAGHE